MLLIDQESRAEILTLSSDRRRSRGVVTCGGKVEVGGEVVDVDVLGCGAGERNACNDRAQQETTLYLVTTALSGECAASERRNKFEPGFN